MSDTNEPLPLVRTGQGDYTNDYTPSVNPNVVELIEAAECFLHDTGIQTGARPDLFVRLRAAIKVMKLELGFVKPKH